MTIPEIIKSASPVINIILFGGVIAYLKSNSTLRKLAKALSKRPIYILEKEGKEEERLESLLGEAKLFDIIKSVESFGHLKALEKKEKAVYVVDFDCVTTTEKIEKIYKLDRKNGKVEEKEERQNIVSEDNLNSLLELSQNGALVIYAKIAINGSQFSRIANNPFTSVVNARGRLVNDVFTSMVTTGHKEDKIYMFVKKIKDKIWRR